MENNRKSLDEFCSNFLKVHNSHSNFNHYYHMDTPFSVVLETYRSDLEKRYFKIVNFSPDAFSQALIDDEEILNAMLKRPLHQHDFFEFMFVQQGEVAFKIENTERIYPAGTGCIVNCNLRHLEKLSKDFRIFFLNLSKGYVKQLLESASELYFSIENNSSLHTLFQFLYENASDENLTKKEYLDFFPVFHNKDSFEAIYELEEKIAKILFSPVAGSSFFINGYIYQLFDYLSNKELYHTTTVDIDYNNDFLIFTKLTHLLEDSQRQLSRHELSRLLNYSGDYLNRISKKYTGMTLFEYSMTFIMRKAEFYLLKTDDAISHIISRLGFTNRTHFYNIFYSKHKMTPKEYRQKYLQDSYDKDK